jgi:alcohol dehydrogenase class IV
LPHVMHANLAALRQRTPASPALERYTEVARLLTGRSQASAEDGVSWVRELSAALAIPTLASYGIGAKDFASIAAKARVASSMQGNPIALEDGELIAVLERSL